MVWRQTKLSHAGHDFLGTWVSLFHITMALGTGDRVFLLLCSRGRSPLCSQGHAP